MKVKDSVELMISAPRTEKGSIDDLYAAAMVLSSLSCLKSAVDLEVTADICD